jgi:putative copper export protein/mono/diheme cytochrome c family protein
VLPPFDLQGGASLAAARDAAVTGLLSAFGTIAFRVLVAPKAFAQMQPDAVRATKRDFLRLAQGSIAFSLLGTGVWLVLQAANMADAGSMAAALAALPIVIAKTSFGHVVVLQSLTLLIWSAVLGWRDRDARLRAALLVATLAVALQSGHSHAFSMVQAPSLLLACDILHLWGAGGWVGGLMPLLLLVRSAPPKAGATAARWFSPLGQGCIAALVVSAAIQGWVLVASFPGLIGTAYGWLILVKIALFGALLAFAWFNRFRFAPALLKGNPERARRLLVRSITWQTGFALAIVVAAAVLSELPPAMHLQALWPFDMRFSLAAIQEDPDFRHEVLQAGSVLAAALALLLLALVLGRLRIAALVVVIAAGWFAAPHLDLLLVTAYPTSFYHSPTGFTAADIVDGQAVYAQNCVGCHGAGGGGDGAMAASLPVPPADLTAAHLWMHSDGELFWWISHGMRTPENAPAMPGFADVLDDDSRWAVIDYIRAHNAGHAKLQTGEWPVAMQAPDFGARCGARAVELSDLRGRFVRLVIGGAPPVPATQDAAVTILAAMPDGSSPGNTCLTRDETVPSAYAIIAGLAPAAMTGVQFLIDGDGWVRAMQTGPGGWDDPKRLDAEVTALREHMPAHAVSANEPMKMPM